MYLFTLWAFINLKMMNAFHFTISGKQIYFLTTTLKICDYSRITTTHFVQPFYCCINMYIVNMSPHMGKGVSREGRRVRLCMRRISHLWCSSTVVIYSFGSDLPLGRISVTHLTIINFWDNQWIRILRAFPIFGYITMMELLHTTIL